MALLEEGQSRRSVDEGLTMVVVETAGPRVLVVGVVLDPSEELETPGLRLEVRSSCYRAARARANNLVGPYAIAVTASSR